MIFKRFKRKLLKIFLTGVWAFGFPVSYNYTQSQEYLNNENNLTLTTPDKEINKMSELNFKYNSNKNNYVYITDSNKNEIAKKISVYMFNNERDYYDAALETLPSEVKKSFVNNKIKNLKLSLAKEYQDIGWTFNMYYISGKNEPEIKNIYRLLIFQCPFLEYLKWNNIGNNQYTISFSLPTIWSVGLWSMNNDYVTDNNLVGTFIQMELNPNIMTFSFSNIIFQKLVNNISNFYYVDIDLMNLTSDTLKNLFKLYNNLIPLDLNYSISLSNNLHILNLKRVSYKISENQNFTLYYEGNYSITFVENNYQFNWEIISSTYSLITVTEKDISDNLILNKYYKEKIGSLSVEKNYDNNSALVNVTFNENKYKNLIFYDFLKNYFLKKSFVINFQQNIEVNFKLANSYQQIFIDNFKSEYVVVNFVYYPYFVEIIELSSITKNSLLNSVSFLAKLRVVINGKSYIISVNGLVEGFEYFSFFSEQKIKDFILENFYENDEINYQKLKETLNKQSSWDYISNYSKNLLFRNIQIKKVENVEILEISLDVYNSLDIFLENKKIEISLERENNKNNDEEIQNTFNQSNDKNFNLNYLYFLLLIIPVYYPHLTLPTNSRV